MPTDNWNRAWNQPFTSIYSVRPDGSTGRPTFKGDVRMNTAPSNFGSTPQLDPIISGLLTPGLVPDIARQSAEVAGGRGVGGSPAGGSTAVRMSEQNWLQRLALANSLLSGEASRELPYQITPYQAEVLAHQRAALEAQERIARMNNRRTGSLSPGGGGGGGSIYPFANMNFGGSGGGGSAGGSVFGGGGGAGIPETLEDVYEWLGFGNFGEVLGDSSSGFPEFREPSSSGLENWDWNWQAPMGNEFDWDF